jgi:hypothetical protein
MTGPRSIMLGATDITTVLTLVGIMVAVVVVTTVVLMFARRRLLAAGGKATSAAGVMEEMRRLHEEGKLSDAEFAAVRTRMAGKVQAAVAEDARMKEESAAKPGGNLKRTKVIGAETPGVPPVRPAPKRTDRPPGKGQ